MIRALSLFAPVRPASLATRIRNWRSVSRQRHALSRLDTAALRDIGLSREQAENEANRPFWDASANWRV
ncbi:DUF1127 domain-containing protein [Thalassococcus sp. CAU 1522]|uniref:DUF1127 domain-containing protein n=1 Tax=Thalassococcus arenae TaxID=2851652 RepID=A0ABS6N2R9_9RHOB|nr:DUF1127 domain-containing protein [Thalassococcus arenae]MBV2358308.1 DUF1127 domain-containing protein [Thalassococcus arenae]